MQSGKPPTSPPCRAARVGCHRRRQAGGHLGQLPDQGRLVVGRAARLRCGARGPRGRAGPRGLRAAHGCVVPAD
eukprot:5789438-Alexandrium_andersonii.AAC.1